MVKKLNNALSDSEKSLESNKRDKSTAKKLKSLVKNLKAIDDENSQKRRMQLSDTMTEIAERLGD